MKNRQDRLIFVTNDDGFDAPGLRVLLNVARRFGDVICVAPETTQSGMSQSITMYRPLFLREIAKEESNGLGSLERYAFSGTPVDCVKIAFDYFLKDRKVDLALSGINHGSNSAANILYSGTMGGAIESSFYNCPSIGFSLNDHSLNADFSHVEPFVERIIEAALGGVEIPFCLNVNIPTGEPRGIKICRQNKGYWREDFFCRKDPRGKEYFWLTGDFVNSEPDATDTDEWALANGYVSVVPVQTDMTAYEKIDTLKQMGLEG